MNGKTHRTVGTAGGALIAFLRTNPADELWKRIVETFGGALGGNLGARVPDWLEPALHPNHRSTIHSIGVGTKVLMTAAGTMTAWEQSCRDRAYYFAALRNAPETVGIDWLKCLVGEFFWRLAAGLASALSFGYGSHLALDATTPMGIPLLTRGF